MFFDPNRITLDPAVKSVKPDAMLSSSKPDKDDIDDLMT